MRQKPKVLLLNLPEDMRNVRHYYHLLSPHGLSLISGFLKHRGCDVTLMDAAGHHMVQSEIMHAIRSLAPDILGLTLITNHLPQTIPFLDDIKRAFPNIITVVGGPHPSAEWENLIRNHRSIDIAVIGEGEEPMFEIIERIGSGDSYKDVSGICYRIGDEVKMNPPRAFIHDLDALPFADWESLPVNQYWYSWTVKKNYAGLSVSRGCPFSCTFCAYYSTLGKKFRKRSVPSVLDELKLLYDRFGVRNIYLTDSTINIDNRWLTELCEGMLKLNRPIIWGCHIRADMVNRETARLMKRSGCNRMFIGVESADNGVLKQMKKGETIERIKEGVEQLHSVGFYPDLGFILGMPGDTEASLMKTITFAKSFRKNLVVFTLATPFPGTELYEIAKSEGLDVKDWSKIDLYSLSYVPKGLTRERIEHYYRTAIRQTYLRPSFIAGQVMRLESLLDFKCKCKLAVQVFTERLITFKR